MAHPNLTGEALDEAIANAARCKAARRHRMEPIPPPVGAPRPSFGSLFTQRCELCGTLSYHVVSRFTGQILYGPSYDWPEWYKATSSAEHDSSWWRATYWGQIGEGMFLDGEADKPVRRKRAS